tara:strand:- start:252 stop:1037 length:786 start_codon:yes stop_codon:yes gene_type:complete
MDQSEGLIQQLAQQAGEERTPPAKVIEDKIDEKAEYEKDLLQGAGGLIVGNSVEKGLKQLAKGNKGKAVLKRLGMTDEDIDTVVDAIKSRDSGALTDFLTRKGTGYAENLAKQIGKKGEKVVQTSAKALKEGRVPTRQEISNSLNEGSGQEVNPTKSNRSGQALKDTEADTLDSQEGNMLDSIINKGKSALKSTVDNLQSSIADIPSKASARASQITQDNLDVIRGAEKSVKTPLSKTNSVFARARAEFEGTDDLQDNKKQ